MKNFISPGISFHISNYYFGRSSSELAKLVPHPYSHRKSTPYSDGLHDFLVIIPRCYKDDHVNSFFPATFGLCNSVPTECFSVTCDLNDHKFRVNGTLLSLGSGKQLYCMLLIFFFLFL